MYSGKRFIYVLLGDLAFLRNKRLEASSIDMVFHFTLCSLRALIFATRNTFYKLYVLDVCLFTDCMLIKVIAAVECIRGEEFRCDY